MDDDFRVDPATEALYEQVAAEILAGEIRRGLWLKATMESGGDDFRARAIYARFRLEQVKAAREVEIRERINAQARANVQRPPAKPFVHYQSKPSRWERFLWWMLD